MTMPMPLTMPAIMDLSLDTLDCIEAPITDMEWGIIAGAAFGAGVIIGAVIVLT